MGRVAAIGECMIELCEHPDGRITRAFGGDTLNTAIYLARLGTAIDYITALGDDPWSAEMLAAWQAEGVGTDAVVRLEGRLPGLYIIQTDANGERRFSYWRDRAPARDLFALPETPSLCLELGRYHHIYLSGVSLSLYGAAGRSVLLAALGKARQAGANIAFDTNFRPRGWPERDAARAAYASMLAMADIVFASVEDLSLLYGPDWQPVLDQHWDQREIVLKLEHPACRLRAGGTTVEIGADAVAPVIDTTAAGDSFAAAYLAARLEGKPPTAAARAGHALARVVVQHRGAILPRAAWPRAELAAAGLSKGMALDVVV
ncbi:MAG TPA: sugar kinase [Hyphomicrobiaceae bacterium]|nr:sugar kinase [Hyphomicrobiaceae bacterium]